MDTIKSAGDKNITHDEYFERQSHRNGRALLFIGGIAGIVIAIVVSILLLNRPYTYQGSLIDPPLIAPDIQMDDQYSEMFSLTEQQGNVVLIFFGYTHCPDVCPVTLYQYKQIREQLGEQSVNVRFVFITVDPERDTREVLQIHLAKFDPAIIGLTADHKDLAAIWQAYGVAQEKRDVSGATGYLVDHTARLYAIDKKGYLRLTYPFGIETEKIIEDVDHLLREYEG